MPHILFSFQKPTTTFETTFNPLVTHTFLLPLFSNSTHPDSFQGPLAKKEAPPPKIGELSTRLYVTIKTTLLNTVLRYLPKHTAPKISPALLPVPLLPQKPSTPNTATPVSPIKPLPCPPKPLTTLTLALHPVSRPVKSSASHAARWSPHSSACVPSCGS